MSKKVIGLEETVVMSAKAIDLRRACCQITSKHKIGVKRVNGIKKKYLNCLIQFALSFDGAGVVSFPGDDDSVLLWKEHCDEGSKYAKDILSIADAVISFHGKDVEEKFPDSGPATPLD
jgi:hypothetical protein